jgi:hypothetical protein
MVRGEKCLINQVDAGGLLLLFCIENGQKNTYRFEH